MLDLLRYEPFGSRFPERRFLSWYFGPSIFHRREDDDAGFVPKVDVSESENEFIIRAEVPGYKTEDIRVQVENGVLKLSAEHNEEKEEKKENYHLKERRYGSFNRSFKLPENVDGEKIEASAKDGVLTIRIPKVEASQPKQIEVKVH